MFILFSTKAQESTGFLVAQIAVIIIAVIGPMMILAGIGSYIQEQVKVIVSVKLTANLITLAQNSLYSMPAGITEVESTLPRGCRVECLDCKTSMPILPGISLGTFTPIFLVSCNCDNFDENGYPFKEEPLQILNVEANQKGLVCDGMWVDEIFIQPVLVFREPDPKTAGSYGIRFRLKPHPKYDFYWTSVIDPFSGRAFFRGERTYTTFSELYLNLYDYEAVKRALSPWDIKMPNPFKIEDTSIDIYSSSYWNHGSVTKYKDLGEGLKGILDKIFLTCTNHLTGVNAYSVTIPPGHRIVKLGADTLCEQYCPGLHTLSSATECKEGWVTEICYNLSLVSSVNCNNDSPCCADYKYVIEDLCAGNACTGVADVSSIDEFYMLYNRLNPEKDFLILFNGSYYNKMEDEYVTLPSNDFYVSVTGESFFAKYYTDRGGYCVDPACSEIHYFPWVERLWGPSKDCVINFFCTKDNKFGIYISEPDRLRPCDMATGDSKYFIGPKGVNITFHDRDSSAFAELLKQDFPTEQTYYFKYEYPPYFNPAVNTSPFEGCRNSRIVGVPVEYASSMAGIASKSIDTPFALVLNASPDTINIKLEASQ